MMWWPDEWAPLVIDSCAGQGGRQSDGRLMGRAWAKMGRQVGFEVVGPSWGKGFSYLLYPCLLFNSNLKTNSNLNSHNYIQIKS
jgi:hypothetical protein